MTATPEPDHSGPVGDPGIHRVPGAHPTPASAASGHGSRAGEPIDPEVLDRAALIDLARSQAERVRLLEQVVGQNAPSPTATDSGFSWSQLQADQLPFAGAVDFRMMVERCSVPMVVTIPDGSVLYANRAALGLMDVDDETRFDGPLLDRNFFADPAQSDTFMTRQLAGENPVRERCEMVSARGRRFEALIVHHTVRDAAGNICYGVSTLQDITLFEQADADRRRQAARTTRRLAQSEARYHALFRQIPEAIFLVEADGEHRIIDANPAAEALLDLPGRDLLNRPIGNYVVDRRTGHGACTSIGADSSTTSNAPQSLSGYRVQRRDSSWSEIEGSMQRLEYGGRSALLLIARDVTWRREAEAHIRMLSDAIDAMPEGVAIFGPDGAIRYANAALLDRYGWTTDEGIGQPVESLGLHIENSPEASWSDSESSRHSSTTSRRRLTRLTPLPDALADHTALVDDESATTWTGPIGMRQMLRPWSARLLVRAPGLPSHPARLVCSPVFDPAARIEPDSSSTLRGVVVVLHDLTAEQHLQEHLLQSEKLASMGTLVVGLTRELNAHLAPIVGFAQLLAERRATETDHGYYVDRIQDSARSARTIIGELQDFAMPPGDLSAVNITRLLRDVAALIEYPFRDRGVNLQLQPADEQHPARVLGNREQLRSVLLHLVRNALDASDRGSTVRVAVSEDGDVVQLEVLDEGHGVTPDVQARMFDPFFTTRTVGKGIGLGLSVCYGVVRDLGGTIDGGNREDRRGARFLVQLPAWHPVPGTPHESAPVLDARPATVSLPAAEPARAGAGSSGRPASSPASTSRVRSSEVPPELLGRTVLIVDDEPAMVSLLTRLFSSRGFVVRAYTDPERALQGPDPSDLVITDVWMPQMDGVSMREAYRNRWPDHDTRFIFVTGDTADGELERAIRSRGDVVVQKPFDIALILQQAITSLGGRRAGSGSGTGRFERG